MMTIVYSSSPGTASITFKKNLEKILNCKAKTLKIGGGIGHIFLKVSTKEKIFKKLKLNFFKKTELIYGHIFPTQHNMLLLRYYYDIKQIIISYRNIYDQLNYFYKWQKNKLRAPLNFPEDINFSKKDEFSTDSYNIDLNLLLVLNFYKHWFYSIQNNLIKNFTLFSFDEIVSNNKNYQKKILSIFENKVGRNQIKFGTQIKEEREHVAFDTRATYANPRSVINEKFEIHPRHHKMIEDFISSHKDIDFSLITN